MVLRRLPEADVAKMLSKLSGQEPPAALVKLIFSQTEGNPFFVEEVLKHLVEEEKLFDSEGNWRSNLRIDEADVPRGVRLVLGHRIDRVGEQCREILTAAATVGRAVSFRLLEKLVDIDEDSLLNSIEEAERAQLIRSTTKGGDAKFTFPHELIRQTLLSDITLLLPAIVLLRLLRSKKPWIFGRMLSPCNPPMMRGKWQNSCSSAA